MTRHLIIKEEKKYIAMLKIAHFIGEEAISFRKFEKICKVVFTIYDDAQSGWEEYKKNSLHYTNSISFIKFLETVSEITEKHILDNLRKSPCFSIIIDETDLKKSEVMIFYV